jgi:Skp family chaperone for outer membrane proteins
MTVTPDHYDHQDQDSNGADNFQQTVPHHSTIKTVYSPQLLKKFLKDYNEKLSSAEHNLSPEKLEEIIKLKHKIQSQIEKVTMDETESESEADRRQSSVNEQQNDGEEDGERLAERKNYNTKKYYGGNAGNHPYNKNEVGFV